MEMLLGWKHFISWVDFSIGWGYLKKLPGTIRKGLDLAPDRLSTLNNLAALLISSHSLDSAREVLDAAWAAHGKSSDQQSWELLMNTDLQWHLHRQQFDEAHQLAHQLVVAAPSPAPWQTYR